MDDDFGLISIIMAAYNAEKTIGAAIESVLSQTYGDYELIVINDCSSDNTQAVIDEYKDRDSRIKCIINDKNSGVSFSRHAGLDAARGEWIAVLDSDDMWLPEKLEKQIAKQRETGADVIYTGVSFISSAGDNLNRIMHVPDEVNYNQLLKQNIITNSSSLTRKTDYTRFYSSGDDMHEDFALWLKLLKSGGKACGIDEPLTVYRLSANSKSGNKIKSAKMNLRTYKYIGLNPVSSLYYMIWYTVNGFRKYKNLK